MELDHKKTLRFDVELTDKEQKTLDDMRKVCHRSRKNFSEALIKLAIKKFKERSNIICLEDLGVVEAINSQKDQSEIN